MLLWTNSIEASHNKSGNEARFAKKNPNVASGLDELREYVWPE